MKEGEVKTLEVMDANGKQQKVDWHWSNLG
jgi:hypothetical protein